MRALSLAIALALFWLALSGHYKPFLLALGALSVAACVAAAVRLKTFDREGQPFELLLGAVTYYPWLVWEIVKSAWTVSKVILNPSLPISPTMTDVRAGQRTAAGVATYANSITLTPGTITTRIKGDVLTVHALTSAGADDLEGGAMNARVMRFEGRSS